MNIKPESILFLDIETVGTVEKYTGLDERLKAQWSRKAESLRKDTTQTDEELFNEKAGIYAEFGKIACIGIGYLTIDQDHQYVLRVKSFSTKDEISLLENFKQVLEKMDSRLTSLCAHNGKEFDFPYICRRMLVNNIPLPPILDTRGKKPWEVNHIDTMALWKFGDYKSYTSLELLATLFDIPSSKKIMEGNQVNDFYYQKNDIESIAAYCEDDVIAVSQLYLKMYNLPLIPKENIIRIP